MISLLRDAAGPYKLVIESAPAGESLTPFELEKINADVRNMLREIAAKTEQRHG